MQTPVFRKPTIRFPASLLSTALLASTAAMAQGGPVPANDTWRFELGVGAISQPLYPGSGDTKVSPFPTFSANYGRYAIGAIPGAGVPFGVGAFLFEDAHWKFGVALGGNLSSPREEDEAARLRGLGNIDNTVLGAVFGSYSDDWFVARLGVLTDLGGKGHGTRVGVDLEARYRLTDKLMVSAGPGFGWTDKKYTQTFFGITGTQSQNSGLAMYTPDGGLNSIRFSLGANYRFDSNWGLGVRARLASLRGDAVDSPITEKKSQNSLALSVDYRF